MNNTSAPAKTVLSWSSGKDSAWALHLLRPRADIDRGERGEFHTFVHDGPMFARPIRVRTGKTIERGGVAYADLLPT